MSTSPILGAGASGALAATERMQHLRTLIAQVEEGPAGFAAALQAAQSEPGAGQNAGSTSYPSTAYGSATGAYPTAAGSYGSVSAADPSGGLYAADAADPELGQGATYPAAYQSLDATTSPATLDATDTSATATAGATNPYSALIEQAAARNGLDPAVLYGLIQQESGFDPSATSSAGALGLTQLMPSTAAARGVTEPHNPAPSIEGGARYLGELLRQFAGNTTDALAAYNAGPGAVQQYGGVPPYPETQQYVNNVLDNAAAYRQSTAGADVPTAGVPSTATVSATSTPGAIA
jgi:soluble lytic murein transglycosylase-like protein